MAEEETRNYYSIIPANVRYDKELCPNAKLLYGEITALCNDRGYCWATNDYFAKLYNVSKTSISKWIKSLVDKEYIISEIIYKNDTKEIENRCLKINTYITNIKYPIEEKLNRGIEEKLKDNNTYINNTINNIYSEFETLWIIYPRKQGKKDALKHYIKARKKYSYEIIKNGLDKYIDYINKENILMKYIKFGSTWFNQECWNDEYNIEKTKDVPSWFNEDLTDNTPTLTKEEIEYYERTMRKV